MASAVLSYLVIGLGMDFIYKENNWMENIQAAVLVVCCAVFAYQSFQFYDRHRHIALFLSILCFIFAFREVDADKLDWPTWLVFLLAEKGRAIFFIIAFVYLGLILREARYYFANLRAYMTTSLVVYVFIAAFFLIVLSSAFDKKVIKISYWIFFEELSELVAYCLLFVASLDIVRALNRVKTKIAP